MSRFLTRTGPHYEASQSDLIGPYCDSYCDQGNHFFYGCREKKLKFVFHIAGWDGYPFELMCSRWNMTPYE